MQCDENQRGVVIGQFWYVVNYKLLLYLISKCAFAIGRNRVTWRSINLASALTTPSHFLFRNAVRYNKTNRDHCYRSLLEIVSPQFGKYSASSNISQTSGKQSLIVTSTLVTICILLLLLRYWRPTWINISSTWHSSRRWWKRDAYLATAATWAWTTTATASRFAIIIIFHRPRALPPPGTCNHVTCYHGDRGSDLNIWFRLRNVITVGLRLGVFLQKVCLPLRHTAP